MAQNITLLGASYSDVPAVELPKTGGGTASFIDISDTTATAEDVAQGKFFYGANGVRTEGTATGGTGGVHIDADGYLVLDDDGEGGIDLSSVLETNAHNNITGFFTSLAEGKWATRDLRVSSGTDPINIAFGRTIKGFICYPIGITVLSGLEKDERVAFNISIFTDNGDNTQTLLWNAQKAKNSSQSPANVFNRISSYTFNNGTLSLVPQYPENATYHPFGFNYTYRFVYWWE